MLLSFVNLRIYWSVFAKIKFELSNSFTSKTRKISPML
uniref:Uncharacterized protein n=1 Tax=viral metagenome TaxID=1070528 RepID=A0A6C0EI03_9ZZZZ